MSATNVDQQLKPPPWRDVRVLRIVGQVVFLILVVAFLGYLFSNAQTNLRNANLPTGFDFLENPAGFNITDSSFRPSQSVSAAIWVGIGNTLRVAAVGILMATVIGVLLGIARLSSNWLVRKAAALYVETVRNVPVLIIIIFMSIAIIGNYLQPIQEAPEGDALFMISNRGIWLPWLTTNDAGLGAYWFVMLVAVAGAAVLWRWRTRVNEHTGQPHHRVLWATAFLLIVLSVGYILTGSPFEVTTPFRDGLSVTGGIKLGAAYTALLLGLVVYTASHIAEIVRGSILAVPKGQTEAANALALTGFQRMRFVILPQAMRIMVPPLANQYLNLTKNSSLALAIGYSEVTSTTQIIIGNGNPALQNIGILMVVYLVFSLSISAVANFFNRRLTLVTR